MSSWKQATLPTSASSRYCLLFKVQGCQMLKPLVGEKTGHGVGARVDAVPTLTYSVLLRGRDSSVSIVTCYGLEGPGIEPRWGRDFPHLSRLALGPIQPPVQWVPGLSGGKGGRGVTLTTHPHLMRRSLKSRAIPLLPFWARVTCYRVKPYLTLPILLGECHLKFQRNAVSSSSRGQTVEETH
jgi:hypothetical protein